MEDVIALAVILYMILGTLLLIGALLMAALWANNLYAFYMTMGGVASITVGLTVVPAWRRLAAQSHEEAAAGIQVLAISSDMDEAWQILHHIRSANNPLAVEQNIASYLFTSLRLRFKRGRRHRPYNLC